MKESTRRLQAKVGDYRIRQKDEAVFCIEIYRVLSSLSYCEEGWWTECLTNNGTPGFNANLNNLLTNNFPSLEAARKQIAQWAFEEETRKARAQAEAERRAQYDHVFYPPDFVKEKFSQ